LDPEFTQVGLAMARSIGDHAVKGVGVIAEPEVMMHELREGGKDRFLLLASDGVWEFISSQEAVDIVWGELQKGVGVSGACQVLIEQAAARWRDVEGDYRDDITALLIMLPIFK
jgi:serine/threonine protein phosphatase PrpC